MFIYHQITDVYGILLRMGIKFLKVELFMDGWNKDVVGFFFRYFKSSRIMF